MAILFNSSMLNAEKLKYKDFINNTLNQDIISYMEVDKEYDTAHLCLTVEKSLLNDIQQFTNQLKLVTDNYSKNYKHFELYIILTDKIDYKLEYEYNILATAYINFSTDNMFRDILKDYSHLYKAYSSLRINNFQLFNYGNLYNFIYNLKNKI